MMGNNVKIGTTDARTTLQAAGHEWLARRLFGADTRTLGQLEAWMEFASRQARDDPTSLTARVENGAVAGQSRVTFTWAPTTDGRTLDIAVGNTFTVTIGGTAHTATVASITSNTGGSTVVQVTPRLDVFSPVRLTGEIANGSVAGQSTVTFRWSPVGTGETLDIAVGDGFILGIGDTDYPMTVASITSNANGVAVVQVTPRVPELSPAINVTGAFRVYRQHTVTANFRLVRTFTKDPERGVVVRVGRRWSFAGTTETPTRLVFRFPQGVPLAVTPWTTVNTSAFDVRLSPTLRYRPSAATTAFDTFRAAAQAALWGGPAGRFAAIEIKARIPSLDPQTGMVTTTEASMGVAAAPRTIAQHSTPSLAYVTSWRVPTKTQTTLVPGSTTRSASFIVDLGGVETGNRGARVTVPTRARTWGFQMSTAVFT